MQNKETITYPRNKIEYQNDFTSEGGTLHEAVNPVMDKTNMLANTVETVKKARELGATIVYAPITFTDDYHELSPAPYGILKGVVDSKSFRKAVETKSRGNEAA
jgi:ureidoacrylate peracid hydrolase